MLLQKGVKEQGSGRHLLRYLGPSFGRAHGGLEPSPAPLSVSSGSVVTWGRVMMSRVELVQLCFPITADQSEFWCVVNQAVPFRVLGKMIKIHTHIHPGHMKDVLEGATGNTQKSKPGLLYLNN